MHVVSTTALARTGWLVAAAVLTASFMDAQPRPVIVLSRTAISFAAVLGGADAPLEFLTITNGGSGNLNGLNATAVYGTGQPAGWLGLVLSGNRAPATLQLGAHFLTLYTGTYNATVTVSGNRAAPQTVAVTYTLTRDPVSYMGAYVLSPQPTLSCPAFSGVGFGTVEISSMALSVPIADSIRLHTTWKFGGASHLSSFTVAFDAVSQNFRTATQTYRAALAVPGGWVTMNATLAVAGTFFSMTQFRARVDATASLTRDVSGAQTFAPCTPVSVDVIGTK